MEKLNVTLQLQWLTCDPLRFELRFKRFTPLDWCSRGAVGVSSHRCPELALSYIIASRRTEQFNQKIYKGSLSESVRDGERETTANKIRSHQKLFSQMAKKCLIYYSALSFMFNGDLRGTRGRVKSKVTCCVLVTIWLPLNSIVKKKKMLKTPSCSTEKRSHASLGQHKVMIISAELSV